MEAQNNQVHLAEGDGQHGPAQGPLKSFTPGPWAVDPDLADFDFGAPQKDGTRWQLCRYVHVPRSGGRIAQCFANCLVTTTDELEANARLISAAPDMLVALQLAEAYLRERVEGTGGFGETRVLPRVRAALEKARGAA